MPQYDETHVYHQGAWRGAETRWIDSAAVKLDDDHALALHWIERAFGPTQIMTGRDDMPRTCTECLSDIYNKPVMRKTGTFCSNRCAAIAKGRARLAPAVPSQETFRDAIKRQGPHRWGNL